MNFGWLRRHNLIVASGMLTIRSRSRTTNYILENATAVGRRPAYGKHMWILAEGHRKYSDHREIYWYFEPGTVRRMPVGHLDRWHEGAQLLLDALQEAGATVT